MFRSFLGLGLACVCATASWAAPPAVYSILDYGAVAGGQTLATAAIQQAIDAAAAAGGGTVTLPAGTYRSGTIYLKSNVTLFLEPSAVLLGSSDLKDYPAHKPDVRSYTDQYVCQSLIAGEGLERVAIVGRGTIDGNGGAFRRPDYLVRPYVIRLVRCRDVRIEGVRLQNSPMWMQHYLACDQLRLRSVTVFNHASYNNDGLDIDGCHDVCVSECILDSDDDALCLKSTLGRSCRNVTISNCILSSHCNALKMGTESNGGFQDVVATNCTICSPRFSKSIYGVFRGMAGIALETVDGGILDRVAISNFTIEGVSVPIFLRLGNRARPFTEKGPRPGVGALRNVQLSNIVATGASNVGCSITGIPDHCVENVSLSNIQITFEGGGAVGLASRSVPEFEAQYPESRMFGVLPAYGFYCRHVRGLKLQNLRLLTAQPDRRHAMICEDAQDLAIDGLDAAAVTGGASLLRFAQVQEAIARNCTMRGEGGTFVKLEGKTSANVVLLANELGRAEHVAETASDVPAGVLSSVANHTAGK